jgi:hypothetical protein
VSGFKQLAGFAVNLASYGLIDKSQRSWRRQTMLSNGVASLARDQAWWRDSNRLYFDKLIRVTENRYVKERAGWVMVAETAGDFIPRHNEIVPTGAGHEDRRLEHVTHLSATLFQSNSQVVERPTHLVGDITQSDYSSLIIEAGTHPR